MPGRYDGRFGAYAPLNRFAREREREREPDAAMKETPSELLRNRSETQEREDA
jgi:hypothetical protein